MHQYRPLTSRAISRFLRRPFAEAAEKIVQISSSKLWKSQLPICLPGELDRFTGHHPVSDPRINLSRVKGEPFQQSASKAFLLRDVIIADGTLLAFTASLSINEQRRRLRLPSALQTIDEGAFCSTKMTERYFGHWLTDGLAHELWAKDQSLLPMVLKSPVGRVHEPGYRALTDMHALPIELARVDRFWLVEDHELTPGRVERLQRLRERLRAKAVERGPTHVFISRGTSGVGRVLENERKVIEMLRSRGFAILSPESSNAQAIVDTLANARVIVAVEGSAISHAIMASPHASTLVAIFPPTQMNMIFKTYADVLGFQFAIAVGEASEGERFNQPPDRLARLLDMIG